MNILIRDSRDIYRHSILQAIGKEGTVEDVLDYLLGKYDEGPEAEFCIRQWVKPERKVMHRLNMFWALPLTVACMPYQYVVKGVCGWDDTTIFGRWILRITGHLRDSD